MLARKLSFILLVVSLSCFKLLPMAATATPAEIQAATQDLQNMIKQINDSSTQIDADFKKFDDLLDKANSKLKDINDARKSFESLPKTGVNSQQTQASIYVDKQKKLLKNKKSDGALDFMRNARATIRDLENETKNRDFMTGIYNQAYAALQQAQAKK